LEVERALGKSSGSTDSGTGTRVPAYASFEGLGGADAEQIDGGFEGVKGFAVGRSFELKLGTTGRRPMMLSLDEFYAVGEGHTIVCLVVEAVADQMESISLHKSRVFGSILVPST